MNDPWPLIDPPINKHVREILVEHFGTLDTKIILCVHTNVLKEYKVDMEVPHY